MKIFLTLILTVFIVTVYGQVPFTQGNVVVFRVGDGLAPLRNVSTKAFLDEYTPVGILVQSIELPRTASGGNFALTSSGTATTEGFINLSTNRKYITFGGYNADTGVVSIASLASSTYKRVIGTINNAATTNITTSLDSAFNAFNIRSVVSTDGTAFWMSGSGSGIRYTTLGVSADTRVSSAQQAYPSNFRSLNIFGGQLYIGTHSSHSERSTRSCGNIQLPSKNIE